MDFISKLFWSALFFGIGVYIIKHFQIGHTNASLAALFVICFLYALIPDFNKDNSFFGLIMVLVAGVGVWFYFVKHYILPTILVFLGLAIVYYLAQKKERMESLFTGVIFSIPLWFINPIYAVFGFLGFFSVWVGNRL